MNGVVKFMPVWRRGLKPSDNPEIVREFDTRLLLVVFPVLCLLFISIFFELYFFYLFSTWELVPFFFLFFLPTTRPWRLCPLLVCLFIQQFTRYTLAADGAVFDTPKKN